MWSSAPPVPPALCSPGRAQALSPPCGQSASAVSPAAAGGTRHEHLPAPGHGSAAFGPSLCTGTPSSVHLLALTSIPVWVTCEGGKIKNNKAESKSEQTYLSQAEAKRLQDEPQGQEAPGHGWREQPEAAGAGGQGERGRSPSRLRPGPGQGGGDWRRAGGRAGEDGAPAAP